MGNRSKSATKDTMLKSLVFLCVCVVGNYGEYVMPGLGDSGRVRPLPTRPPTTAAPTPACDSCCPAPPPVDEDKVACAALDKRLIVLEDAMRDAECSTENADDETIKLCAQLTFEVTPTCMNATNIDSDECFRRVEQELGKEGIMNTCKCEAWKQLKEDIMVSVELVCEDSTRKGKNQCITPVGQVIWWQYLNCVNRSFVGRFACAWFLNRQRCFNNWATRPVWHRRRVWGWGGRNQNSPLLRAAVWSRVLGLGIL